METYSNIFKQVCILSLQFDNLSLVEFRYLLYLNSAISTYNMGWVLMNPEPHLAFLVTEYHYFVHNRDSEPFTSTLAFLCPEFSSFVFLRYTYELKRYRISVKPSWLPDDDFFWCFWLLENYK